MVRRAALGSGARVGDLAGQHPLGLAALALLLRLAHGQDHVQTGGVGRGQLLGQRRVGLAEVLPPLRVAEQHAVHAQVEQHGRRDLAGEGALRRLVHVLGVDAQLRSRRSRHRLGQRRERHAHGHLDARPAAAPPASATNGPVSLAVLCIFQFPATNGRRALTPAIPPARPRRAAACPRPARARRRPPVETWVMPIGHAGHVDGRHRVAAADHRDGARAGHRVGHRQRARGERLQLEHAHRAVPEDRLGAAARR